MKGICAYPSCSQEFMKKRKNHRFCSYKCQKSFFARRFNYGEKKERKQAREEGRERCQYLEDPIGEACGKACKVGNHFLCEEHFELGDQVPGTGARRRRTEVNDA